MPARAPLRGGAAHGGPRLGHRRGEAGVAIGAAPSRRSGRVRRRSPDLARAVRGRGATAVSILTEPTRFGGSDDDLVAAARVGPPVLRKDFVVDRTACGRPAPWAPMRSCSSSAPSTTPRLRELIAAAGEAGLDALVEVHDADELERALAADATLIGVNARDLARWPSTSSGSLPLLRRAAECGATVVAESGIGGAGRRRPRRRGRCRRRPRRHEPAARGRIPRRPWPGWSRPHRPGERSRVADHPRVPR